MRRYVAELILASLALAGCASAPAPVSPPTAQIVYVTPALTPQIVYVTPALTPQLVYVTAAPTATPTSTRKPTEAPLATFASSGNWSEFYEFEQSSRKDMVRQTKSMNEVSNFKVGQEMANTGNDGIEWLNNHPADSCYKDAHTDLTTVLVSWSIAGISLMQNDVATATTWMQHATDAFDDLNSAVDTAVLACS